MIDLSHSRATTRAGAAGSVSQPLAAGGNLRAIVRQELAWQRLEDKLRHARLPWWRRWFA